MYWNVSVAGKCQAWMTSDLFWVDLTDTNVGCDCDPQKTSDSTQEVGINLKAELLPEG